LLKVANIIEEGRYGGPQARIITVAEKLKSYGIETFVIFPDKDSDVFYEKLIHSGIKFRRLKIQRLARQKTQQAMYCFHFIKEVFALALLIKRERVDIVQCNGSHQIKGLIAGRLALKRTIWVLNSTTPRKTVFWLLLIFSRLCDGFVLTGNRARDYHMTKSGLRRKLHTVIHPPVDTVRLNPRKTLKKDLLYRNNSVGLSIVTIANINPIKGLEYFIEMAHILSRNGRKENFYIVGPELQSQKKYFNYLREIIKRSSEISIELTGPVYEVEFVLAKTDIFVCSSLAEAGPVTVWEAMAMARPIVSTDVGDVTSFIQDGENGFVVPVKNAGALAEKVSLLIDNEKLRKEFGRKARETAIKHLDVEICANKYADFYRTTMGVSAH